MGEQQEQGEGLKQGEAEAIVSGPASGSPRPAPLTFFEWYGEREDGNPNETSWIEMYAHKLAWESYRTGAAIHDGDCVSKPYTCNLCALEGLLTDYRKYVSPEREIERLRIGPKCSHCDRGVLQGESTWAVCSLCYDRERNEVRAAFEAQKAPMCAVHEAAESRPGGVELVYGNRCVACSLSERIELLDILAAAMPELKGWAWADSVTAMRALVRKAQAGSALSTDNTVTNAPSPEVVSVPESLVDRGSV